MRTAVAAALLVASAGSACAVRQLPALGAGGLLRPARHHVNTPAPDTCEDAIFAGSGVTLKGWRCRTPAARRGTIVYLHGIADNRASAAGIVRRFEPRGFDVIAYDSRAHGESDGTACTYGFYEKQDLRRVIDGIPPGPVVLIGTSLGAAVALQEAGDDPRVTAIVAAETFSDLKTIASDRAPFLFTKGAIRRAFALAERQAAFRVDEVSPVDAASHITVPVLLIHGEGDVDTRPEHSRRVFDALRGPKRLIVVPGARHNGSLRADMWPEIDRWIDQALAR